MVHKIIAMNIVVLLVVQPVRDVSAGGNTSQWSSGRVRTPLRHGVYVGFEAVLATDISAIKCIKMP